MFLLLRKCTVVIVAIVVMSVDVSAALITYQLIDGAAGDQAGHTISGTITMDPICGAACVLGDIDSWEYTVTGPMGTFIGSSDIIGELSLNPDVRSWPVRMNLRSTLISQYPTTTRWI